MNNLMKLIDQCNNQQQIISLLKHNDIFDFVRHYLMDNHNVDFDGEQFLNEQCPITLGQIKGMVNEAIYMSIY